MKASGVRAMFEVWVLREFPDLGKQPERLLERDDMWTTGGYEQPLIDNAWRAFRAGYLAKRRRK